MVHLISIDMKPLPPFSHRPPSKTTLLHDPWPGIPVYFKSRTSPKRFWQRFLSLRKQVHRSNSNNPSGLSA